MRRHVENSRARRRNPTKKSIAIDRAPIGIANEWYLWRAIRTKILTYFAREASARATGNVDERASRTPSSQRKDKEREKER